VNRLCKGKGRKEKKFEKNRGVYVLTGRTGEEGGVTKKRRFRGKGPILKKKGGVKNLAHLERQKKKGTPGKERSRGIKLSQRGGRRIPGPIRSLDKICRKSSISSKKKERHKKGKEKSSTKEGKKKGEEELLPKRKKKKEKGLGEKEKP